MSEDISLAILLVSLCHIISFYVCISVSLHFLVFESLLVCGFWPWFCPFVQVGMWSRAAPTACSPTCSSLWPRRRNPPPCSEAGTTSWADASSRPPWRRSTSSACLRIPAQTASYSYELKRNAAFSASLLETLKNSWSVLAVFSPVIQKFFLQISSSLVLVAPPRFQALLLLLR